MYILLLFCFALFYYLTRIVWIRIIKNEQFKIEIHLILFAIHINNYDGDGDNINNKDNSMSIKNVRIITDILTKLRNATIEIKSILIPINTKQFNKSTILKPLRQNAYICALIAYLRTKTKKLTLEDNAIILSSDIPALHYYVTIKLRLYELIFGFFSIRHRINNENKRAKD